MLKRGSYPASVNVHINGVQNILNDVGDSRCYDLFEAFLDIYKAVTSQVQCLSKVNLLDTIHTDGQIGKEIPGSGI